MKTVRILLYPTDRQLQIMEEITKIYDDILLHGVIQKSWDVLPEEIPQTLCDSSAVQLCRDLQHRLRRASAKKTSLPHPYCRWGSDYQLSEDTVILPLGKGFETHELSIRCLIRPFQIKLLADLHPETIVLKRMRNHWFVYLLV